MGKSKDADRSRRHAAKVCRSKIAYATEHEARQAASVQGSMFAKLMDVYVCGFGGKYHWHTTSN